MANLILNGSTSGSVTLSSPAVSGTTTLTLPATTGTVLTSASNTGFPAGSVLQVVTGTLATAVNFTGNTFTDLGLSALITPSSSSNKILIIVTLMNVWKTSANTYYGAQLQRNGTIIQTVQSALYTNSSLERQDAANTFSIYDSPATTSSVTYKIQMRNEPATGTITVTGGNYGPSTITLMEIKG
jgi:hypothetical protein